MTTAMVVLSLSFLLLPIVLRDRKVTVSAGLIAISMPVFAVALYVWIGNPDAIGQESDAEQVGQQKSGRKSGSKTSVGSVASLVLGLEKRLRAEPADAKGWLLLAKSYSHLGRTDDAIAAYAKAHDLGQRDQAFESSLGRAKNQIDAAPVIRGRLTIAASAKDRIGPNDSIFVFAKSIDGSAMPVAVLRKTASDLPFDFELSDKQAMSTTANLSGTSVVKIVARVSSSGNALQAEPGLEVESQPIKVGDSAFVELQLGPTATPDES